MSVTVEATYENGVLKPSQPLPLLEHALVRVTVEPQLTTNPKPISPAGQTVGLSLAEKLIAIGNSLPEEVLARLPRDGASQHDHYIYGTPKRTDLSEPE